MKMVVAGSFGLSICLLSLSSSSSASASIDACFILFCLCKKRQITRFLFEIHQIIFQTKENEAFQSQSVFHSLSALWLSVCLFYLVVPPKNVSTHLIFMTSMNKRIEWSGINLFAYFLGWFSFYSLLAALEANKSHQFLWYFFFVWSGLVGFFWFCSVFNNIFYTNNRLILW